MKFSKKIQIFKTLMSLIVGLVALALFIYSVFVGISNVSGTSVPDGLPLDSELSILLGFSISCLLIIVSFYLSPKKRICTNGFEHLF